MSIQQLAHSPKKFLDDAQSLGTWLVNQELWDIDIQVCPLAKHQSPELLLDALAVINSILTCTWYALYRMLAITSRRGDSVRAGAAEFEALLCRRS